MTHTPMWLKEALALALARLKEALAPALMPLKGAMALALVRLKEALAPALMPLKGAMALALVRLKQVVAPALVPLGETLALSLALGLCRKETKKRPSREPGRLSKVPADVGNATLVVFQQLSVESI